MGTAEIVIIAIILILLFGGKKLPDFFNKLTGKSKETKNDQANHTDENEELQEEEEDQ